MKKTLIAAGIAAVVAAPAAFAEVKISGAVEQQLNNVEKSARIYDTSASAYISSAAGTGVVSSSTTDDNGGSRDNYIKFAASEDLGNGMTAFADMTLDVDASSSKDEKVGLKGSFGTVIAGRFEDFTEGKIMSRFTLEGDGSAGGGLVEDGAIGYVDSDLKNEGRNNNGIAYVSPTMNGLHVGVGAYVVEEAITSASGKDEAYDAIDMALFYDNGPLSLAVARETVNSKDGTSALTGAQTADQKSTTIAASYAMGDLKATVGRQKIDGIGGVVNQENKAMLYRLDYNMGNNRLTVAYNDGEFTDANYGAVDHSAWSLEAAHNFSKRTSVYVNYTDYSVDNVTHDGSNTPAWAGNFNGVTEATGDRYEFSGNMLAVGLKHKF